MFQYYVSKDGEEVTSYVSVAGTWLASVMSFVSEKPSLENIRAITPGSIFMVSRANLKKLVSDIPALKNFLQAGELRDLKSERFKILACKYLYQFLPLLSQGATKL